MIKINVAKAKKCNGEWSLYITFPYDSKILDTVRSFNDRYWDAKEKTWELPFKYLAPFVSQLSNYEFDITGPGIPTKKEEAKAPEGFEFKTNPFQHQIEGFNFGLQNSKWLLGDEQGLGKTKQVIDIAVAQKLAKGFKHCLIICGVNGLKWNWVEEIKTHSNETGWILGQRTKAGKTVIGSNADKLADLNALEAISSYFLITNIETI